MKKEFTLADRVFEEITASIRSGYMKKGSRFISVRKMREEYNIGFRTARQVTKRLKEAGYIKVEPKKAPVVTLPANTPDDIAILENKYIILSSFGAIRDILPCLLAFCMTNCNFEELNHARAMLKTSKRCLDPARWQLLHDVTHEILRAGGGRIMSDIYEELSNKGMVSYFFEQGNKEIDRFISLCSTKFVEIANIRGFNEKRKLLYSFLSELYNIISGMIDKLSLEHPDITPKKSKPEIRVYRTKPYKYINIIHDIIYRIGKGEFKKGDYLPNEAALSKYYNVSVSTLRRALADLRNMGYCDTYNVKGTVIRKRETGAKYDLKSIPDHNIRAYEYMKNLQLACLLVLPFAKNGALSMTKEQVEDMYITVKQSGNCLEAVVDYISEMSGDSLVRDIFIQVENAVRWNYYTYCIDIDISTRHIRLYCKRACDNALAGDMSAFAHELSSLYCYMLDTMQEYLSTRCEIKEISEIVTPHIAY